jgi:hypothetical protein
VVVDAVESFGARGQVGAYGGGAGGVVDSRFPVDEGAVDVEAEGFDGEPVDWGSHFGRWVLWFDEVVVIGGFCLGKGVAC